MSIQLEAWHLISLAVTLFGANAAAVRWGRDREAKGLDERFRALERLIERRFAALEAGRAREAENLHKLERELLKMQADMPLNYVRREDYLRGQSVMEAKLDAIAHSVQAVHKGTVAFLNTQGVPLQ